MKFRSQDTSSAQKKEKFQRRRILHFLFVGGLTLTTGSFGLVTFNSDTKYIRSVLKRRMPYLSYTEDTVLAFANDMLSNGLETDKRFKVLSTVGHPLSKIILYLHRPSHERLEAFEEAICSTFLQSTDFFYEGERIDRELQYSEYADPYTNSCSNPIVTLT